MDRDFALEDPEVVMLLTTLINILGHDNCVGRPIGSFIEGGIWRKGSTRPPKHQSDEVEKRVSLRE